VRVLSRRRRPKELFVSHSSRDHRFAVRLVHVLQAHGVRCWFSPRHIVAAQQWHDEIGRALGRCDWFLVILSPHGVRSAWVKRELMFALNSPQYRGRIVPLLRRPCQHQRLSWTLEQSQFVDFTGTSENGLRALLRIWGVAYKQGDANG
jgi:hypothetical protein